VKVGAPHKSEAAILRRMFDDFRSFDHGESTRGLRSDKPFAECRAEMMKSCQSTMGTQGCPMMGMGQGAMQMHGGMMQDQSETSGAKK
jgi:hypothetical protein